MSITTSDMTSQPSLDDDWEWPTELPQVHHQVPKLDYSTCTNEELDHFLFNRGIRVEGKPDKQQLVAQLTEADAKATFRFLDLFPEMRNMVYEVLLVSYREEPSAPFGCHPEILATCKQIHSEASGILYSKNFASISLTSLLWSHIYYNGSRWSVLPRFTSNAVDRQADQQVFDIREWVLHATPLYKAFLHKIENLHIRIGNDVSFQNFFVEDDFRNHRPPHWHIPLVNALRILTSSLMANHCLKKVEVFVTEGKGEVISQDIVEELLRPLTRLSGIAEVVIRGKVTEDTVASIKGAMQSSKHPLNVMKVCSFIWREVAFIDSLLFVNPGVKLLSDQGLVHERLSERYDWLRYRVGRMFAAAKVPNTIMSEKDMWIARMVETHIDEASFDRNRRIVDYVLDQLIFEIKMVYTSEASVDESQELYAEEATACEAVARISALKQARQSRLEYYRQHGIETAKLLELLLSA